MKNLVDVLMSNGIIGYSVDGSRRASWFNYFLAQNTVYVQTHNVRVFSNDANSSSILAHTLKQFIESNYLYYQVSIAVMAPMYDRESQGYYSNLRVMTGDNLLHHGSTHPKAKTPTTSSTVVDSTTGNTITNNGNTIVN